MIEATIDKLITMKLNGMAEGVREQMSSPAYRDLSFEERLNILVDKEMTSRENRQLKLLLSHAHLRHLNACFEDMDFRIKRNITKDMMLNLIRNEWIRKNQNVIITGPTGTGKTYIACVLGNSAVRGGITTLYTRLSQEIRLARADGRYPRLLSMLMKKRLLIIDVHRRGKERPPGDRRG